MLFFYNDTATTEIYTLSLHDALPSWVAVAQEVPRRIHEGVHGVGLAARRAVAGGTCRRDPLLRGGERRAALRRIRSEEHTSELQSRQYLVCRLLLEKKEHRAYLGT